MGPIAQPFYAYAWWSYILVLDGVVALRQGGSLLTTGRRHFFPIFLWSITFWFFFELLNLRYQNWYYVGVFAAEQASDLLAGGLFAIACFSTVFFGLFETYEVLTAFSFARSIRAEPRELPGWVSYAVQGGGLVLIALSLLFSHYLAPLVWGSVTFLIDPWNYRRGARSVLWELSQGNWGLLLRLLVSGLLCGIVWESFNFYAPQKWIYTVRGLEELKLFEMPVLGFLGFPALAADAFAAYAALSFLFHGNETWETSKDRSQPLENRIPWSFSRFAATLPLHIMFWGTVTFFSQMVNVGSVQLELEDLTTLPSSRSKLCVAPAYYGRDSSSAPLSIAIEEPASSRRSHSMTRGSRSCSRRPNCISSKASADHGHLLRHIGILRVEQLKKASPDELFARLERARADKSFPALRLGMVRVWISSARATPGKGRETEASFSILSLISTFHIKSRNAQVSLR